MLGSFEEGVGLHSRAFVHAQLVLHYVVVATRLVAKLRQQFKANAVAVQLLEPLGHHPQRALLIERQLRRPLERVQVLHGAHLVVHWKRAVGGVQQPCALFQLDI